MSTAATTARKANAPDLWDALWSKAESRDWRAQALSEVYRKIIRAVPTGAQIVDLGGGVGELGVLLKEERGCEVHLWDGSLEARNQSAAKGLYTRGVDLESWANSDSVPCSPELAEAIPRLVVATEVLEHLTRAARMAVSEWALAAGECALFSVPNNRLGPPGSPGPGPKEEQHTIAFTAITLRRELELTWPHVRVEALGPFLLAYCSTTPSKPYTLSLTLPVRDEEKDIERTLASFRGCVDEIVVGIDPRSKDRTREIVAAYADVVFDLVELRGPPESPEEWVPEEGIHFAHARNQCLRHCSSDWIFMTEGHEHLAAGHDVLLRLHELRGEDGSVLLASMGELGDGPGRVAYVWRQGDGQRWAFPWLCVNDPDTISYVRGTHNMLDYPTGTPQVRLPQVITLHQRHRSNANARAVQRKLQNRRTLLEDWEVNQNAASLFYYGQEIRAEDPEGAIIALGTYLETDHNNGLARYQARLMLSKLLTVKARRIRRRTRLRVKLMEEHSTPELLAQHEDLTKSEEGDAAAIERRVFLVLCNATADDWTRTEHWMWLGDLAYERGDYPEALQFYRYLGTVVGEPPFTLWWHDCAAYTYNPCFRLAMTYGDLGRFPEALMWARENLKQLPDDANPDAFEESRANILLLERKLGLAPASEAEDSDLVP